MSLEEPTARYLAEGLGTLLLVFTIGCNVINDNYVWGYMSVGSTLMVLVYALGSVSGAHFNPAVTLAVMASNKDPWTSSSNRSAREAFKYCAAQMVGGVIGAGLYSLLFWKSFNVSPMPGFTWVEAAWVEIFYTFMLCFVVLNVACTKANKNSKGYGVAIGFVIIAAGYGAGAVSGAVLNPAAVLAMDLASAHLGFSWCFAYIGYQLIGAACAALLFGVIRPSEVQGEGAPTPAHSMGAKLISEFVGTFMLVLTVGLCSLAHSRSTAMSAAASLTSMIYAVGDISGGHFNPAVTLACVASHRPGTPEEGGRNVCRPEIGGMYIAVQIFAAIVASAVFAGIYGETIAVGPNAGGYGWVSAIFIEMTFTMILCLTVLTTATTRPHKQVPEYAPLAIGGCVLVGGHVVGIVSGGTMNPAVTLGISSTSFLMPGARAWHGILLAVFEFMAAILASLLFGVTHVDEYKLGIFGQQGRFFAQQGVK